MAVDPIDPEDTDRTPGQQTPEETAEEFIQRLLERIAAQSADLLASNARIAALEDAHQQQPPVNPPVQPVQPVQPVPPVVPPVQPAPVHSKDPKLSPPPEFSGKISEFRNFMAQCNLVIELSPNTYPTDRDKVLFVISRLRGDAMSWARPVVEENDHALRNNFAAFKTALSGLYLDRNYKDLCKSKLRNLKMTKSAATYAVDFATLIAPFPEKDDQSKHEAFYNGLHDDIKDALAIAGPAETYEKLVQQAIALDQRRYQCRLDKKKSESSSSDSNDKPRPSNSNSNSNSNGSNSRNNNHPNSRNGSHTRNNVPTSRNDSKSNDSKPFESRFREPLTEEEKARRVKLGLCKYCADPGHVVENCPRAPKNSPVVARVSAISLPPPRYPQPSENSNTQATMRTEA